MPKYEKPQKGNPHELVIGQHVFPSKSIARFAGADGRVELHTKPAGTVRRAKPIDSMFCARRAWDHGTEVGFMKMIEDQFQQLADFIIDGAVSTLDAKQMHTISSFYALWVVRAEIRDEPGEGAVIRGIMPSRAPWTKDEEEGLEKAGLAFQRGLTIPTHVMNGMSAGVRVGRFLRRVHPSATWGILQASGGEFVVPDWPTIMVIPINPTLALANHAFNQRLDRENVGRVNEQLRTASKRYFIARDFTACP